MPEDALHQVEIPLRLSMGHIRIQMQGQGYGLLIYCGYRSPQEQAKVYRRSRTWAEIVAKISWYEESGFDMMARCLEDVGPQHGTVGQHRTWVGPCESWHQYQQALDAVPVLDGQLCWTYPAESDAERVVWKTYEALIGQEALSWGGHWKNPDACHVQLSPGAASPLGRYDASSEDTEAIMRRLSAEHGWDL